MGAALGKGAPVIVVGHVHTSEYEDRDGNRRSSLEMRATSVGPDLSRVIVRIEKPGYAGPDADPGPAADADKATDETPTAGDESDASDDGSDRSSPLPLSA